MVNGFWNYEQMRLVVVAIATPVIGYFAPLETFMEALVLMWGLNVWAGMRADGISIKRCKNFKLRKFRSALNELLLYLMLMLALFGIVERLGEPKMGATLVKYMTIVFIYVYLQHSFRNLIIAYPKKVALRVVYHAIRLEVKRLLPGYWEPIMKKLSEDERLE